MFQNELLAPARAPTSAFYLASSSPHLSCTPILFEQVTHPPTTTRLPSLPPSLHAFAALARSLKKHQRGRVRLFLLLFF